MPVGIHDSRSATVRNPAGFTIFTPESGSPIEHDTLKCVHCQFTWQHVRARGVNALNWCKRCGGPVCASPACRTCEHWQTKFMKRMKYREAGPLFGHERRTPGGIILP